MIGFLFAAAIIWVCLILFFAFLKLFLLLFLIAVIFACLKVATIFAYIVMVIAGLLILGLVEGNLIQD